MKRKPKLICETPLLRRKPLPRRQTEFYWTSRTGDHFLCHDKLAKLFAIPKRTKGIRAYLWSDCPSDDAVFLRIRNSASIWGQLHWTTSASHEPEERVSWDAGHWLREHLFNRPRAKVIEAVWLEIELED